MNFERIEIDVEKAPVAVDALVHSGTKTPIIFLHGFGSTKEEYADVVHLPKFRDRKVIIYDAPGYGKSTLPSHTKVTIDFLQKVVKEIANYFGLGKFHLSGHSMGGLTALRFAHNNPDSVASFINIEGNLAPEDCFFSRQIIGAEGKDGREFLDKFKKGVATSGDISGPFYVANLATKINPKVVEPTFTSMVELSDNQDLLGQFLSLPFAKMFVHGDQNRSLSYLEKLSSAGVDVVEIPFSGHFPMYSNAHYLWQEIGSFIERVEGVSNDKG